MDEHKRFGEARFWLRNDGPGTPTQVVYRVWGATFDVFDGSSAEFRPLTPAEREATQAFFTAGRLTEVPEMMASMEMLVLWGEAHKDQLQGSR